MNKQFSKCMWFLGTLLLLAVSPLRAAGPVTHALLTDHFFRLHPQYSEADRIVFRMGTLFADIYLLGGVSMEDTYFNGVTVEEVVNEPSPFIAGLKYHSFVEDLRRQFILEGNYLSLLDNLQIDHPDTYLKFLEDQVVFQSLDGTPWKQAVKSILEEERSFGVEEKMLTRWHYLLDLSFTFYPTTLIFMANLKGNGLLNVSANEVSNWNKTFEKSSKRDDIEDYVGKLFKMYALEIK